jgi:hypothetical protein
MNDKFFRRRNQCYVMSLIGLNTRLGNGCLLKKLILFMYFTYDMLINPFDRIDRYLLETSSVSFQYWLF